MPLQDILDDLAGYLENQIDEGVREVEVFPETVGGMDKIMMRGGARPPRPAPVPARPAVPSPVKAAAPVPAAAGSAAPELAKLAKTVSACTLCPLHKTRTNTVPGQGNPHPEIMFVGEAPGEDEDRQGLAFVGRAGQLLTKMIQAMGYTREEVFIGNILKCRPPENRTPLPDEMETCLPYLREQIALLKPKVIVTLGGTALRGLLKIDTSITGITRLRGKWLSYEGIDLMPTLHPSYLLRTAAAKKDVWEDLKQVLQRVGRTPPPIKRAAE